MSINLGFGHGYWAYPRVSGTIRVMFKM